VVRHLAWVHGKKSWHNGVTIVKYTVLCPNSAIEKKYVEQVKEALNRAETYKTCNKRVLIF
jgi:hypothetical protein